MSEREVPSIERYDGEVHWRCPQLGGEVTFRYCRKLNDGLPCARLVGCWRTVFDVASFVRQHYDPEAMAELAGRPRPDKMAQLVALIESAKAAQSKTTEPDQSPTTTDLRRVP